ncbi:MAG TPA: class I SAM-dependent methyltransferase [Ignavibacteria bacterium]|nr:class I SAM-dependent methyltransferase [Ignavibacteria bacterium]
MKTNKEIKNWYNAFSKKQLTTGTNLRHYTIMNHLLSSGLRKNNSVLEIGCGIGTLTGLLHKYLKKGKLVATDISNDSIKIAKTRISKSNNIDFLTTDMKDFDYPEKFDFIVLPDVLEHIPIEQHQGLFRVLAKHMHNESRLLIHIPHPKALDFIRVHNPDKLQIIDQSISADMLLKDAYSNDLILINYTPCSLFNKEADYVLVRFKKNNNITLTPLPKSVIIRRKFIARIKFLLVRLYNSIL